MRDRLAACAVVALCAAPAPLLAVSGGSLAMRSTGANVADGWRLDQTGYVGTYITLATPGTVTFDIDAFGQSSGGVAPRMNLVVNDSKVGWGVGGTLSTYSTQLTLPAGTHFVRTEFANDAPTVSRTLTVQNLNVAGATISNSTNGTTLNNNARAAADTYIAHYRKGDATLQLSGLVPGTPVQIDLRQHAFNFGAAVPGGSANGVNTYLGGSGTAQQTNYQSRLRENFNAVVPENAGKWSNNASSATAVSMAGVDRILSFAEQNNMRTRMHNVIWGDQQPAWVNTLITNAGTSDAAKAVLRQEISERIDYYVGTGSAGDRAHRYVELDVYNETYHTGANRTADNYWSLYGPQGIADIYREVAQTVAASGATAKLFTNEYNVLGDASYANFYRQNIEEIRNAGIAAGYGDVVGGVGIQYYPNGQVGNHSPNRVMRNLQNLAVQGLPIALTEFGVENGVNPTTTADILEDTVRLIFGNASTTGFFMWGFHDEGNSSENLFRGAAALYQIANSGNNPDWDAWTLTEAGRRWQDLLGIADWDGNPDDGWDTSLTALVAADGTIEFNGFYGDYELTIGGQKYDFTMTKGVSDYVVPIPEPVSLTFISLGVVSLGTLRFGKLRA